MARAEVGDDVYDVSVLLGFDSNLFFAPVIPCSHKLTDDTLDSTKEDPTVNALQRRVADMTGHEAGLFCPTATMTNQVCVGTPLPNHYGPIH